MSLQHRLPRIALVATFLAVAATAHADEVTDQVDALAHGWATATYQTPPAQRDAAFTALQSQAEALVARYPQRAEPLVWDGIITSSHAQYQGLFAAGRSATRARDELQAAEKLDANVLDGAVYVSLGALYYKVPGWPLSFGDKTKAAELLQRALKIDPTGIDPNYFYGDFLLQRGDRAQARTYLQRALAAPPRPGRADADAGRHAEIAALLKSLDA